MALNPLPIPVPSYTFTAATPAVADYVTANLANLYAVLDGALGDVHFATNANINGTKIAAGTITGTQIASSTVTGSNIAASTVTASNIGTLVAGVSGSNGNAVFGGIKMCWGSSTSSSSAVTVNFPFSFSTPPALTLTCEYSIVKCFALINSNLTSGFTFSAITADSTSNVGANSSGETVHWIAMGT